MNGCALRLVLKQRQKRTRKWPISNKPLAEPNHVTISMGSLSKPRRQQQQERRQTKGLMSRTIAAHVRYHS